jgi:hypothetical protein
MRKHIEKVSRQSALLRVQVQHLLGWDDLAYSSFQQQMGLDYLAHHYGDSPLVDRIPEHREFWSWWMIHWTRREFEFIELSTMLFAHELEPYYIDIHDPEQMAYRMHGVVLDQTYERMISHLVDNATKRKGKEVNHGKS